MKDEKEYSKDMLKSFIAAAARHLGEQNSDTLMVKALCPGGSLGDDIIIELTVKAHLAADYEAKEEPTNPLEVN